jgi:20S proteasome alpha/beta subunit
VRATITTIACSRKEIACDLKMTYSGSIQWKCKTKIYQFDAHPDTYPVDFMIGFAGTANDMVTAAEFFSMPDNFKTVPRIKGLNGLVLTAKGEIYIFDTLDKWLMIDEPYAAIGSGSMFAIGAMSAGAPPKEAIKAASKSDPYTGLGCKVMSF